MKTIKIGDKDYKIEFTIEASLFNECTEKVTGLMYAMSEAGNAENIKNMISSMSDIPQTTLTMFYAGLLEHHGEDGDKSVLSKNDAKKLIKQYFKEHSEDETGNFYGFMEILIGQMVDDGFFNQIGLVQVANQTKEQKKTVSVAKKGASRTTEQ